MFELNQLKIDVTGVLADARINSADNDDGGTLRYIVPLTGNIHQCNSDKKVAVKKLDNHKLQKKPLDLNRDRLKTLNERLEEVTELVKESDEKIEVAKTHGVKASQNFEKAHQVIENARESLKVRYS